VSVIENGHFAGVARTVGTSKHPQAPPSASEHPLPLDKSGLPPSPTRIIGTAWVFKFNVFKH